MHQVKYTDLNQHIITAFISGKPIPQIAEETNLDITYITLVLYQEGIHYAYKNPLSGTNRSN